VSGARDLASRAAARLEALASADVAALYGKSLLRTRDWSADDLESLCRVAEAMEALDFAGVATPLFPHQLFWALFFDSSTRTKSSWAGGSAPIR
jgi:aspartate carbamoyltransferase catalytic subunit